MQITILIADDNETMRQMLRLIIGNMQDTTVIGEAQNGAEAIQMAKALSPDIIIMDINMSPVNGFEASRKILQENPAAKIIGLSLHHDPSYIKNMIRIGAKGYVSKDSHHTLLIEAIYKVASGKKFIPDNLDSAY